MATTPLHLRLRKELLKAIAAHVERPGRKNAELAERLGISRARAADLSEGRVELFSLDALADLADRAGLNVRISATRSYREKPRKPSRRARKK